MLNVDVLQISSLMIFFQLYVIYKKLYKSSPFPIGKSKFLRFVIRLFIICSQYTFSITYINYSSFFSLSHFTHYPPYCPSTHTHTKPLTSIYKLIYTHPYTYTLTLFHSHLFTPPQSLTPMYIYTFTSIHTHTTSNNSHLYPYTHITPIHSQSCTYPHLTTHHLHTHIYIRLHSYTYIHIYTYNLTHLPSHLLKVILMSKWHILIPTILNRKWLYKMEMCFQLSLETGSNLFHPGRV